MDNQVQVTEAYFESLLFAYRAGGGAAASGHDLEIGIHGVILPLIFSTYGFSGATVMDPSVACADGIRLTGIRLEAGATCVARFRSRVDTACSGVISHGAWAIRRIQALCVNDGEPFTVTDNARDSLTCSTCTVCEGVRIGVEKYVSPGGGPTGNEWQHVYRDGRNILYNFHSHDAHVVECSVVSPGPCSPQAENTRADLDGTGAYSEGSGGRVVDAKFEAYIMDHREGACHRGARDEYSIVGQSQPADIGVYNVAGRLVKSLAKSSMPAGRHTATWNGT